MKLILTTIFTIFLLTTCRQGEEVLATFDGGEILRKHMREFYELNDIPKNEKSMSIATQKMILDQMINMEILEKDAEKANLANREDVKNYFHFVERGLVVNLYLKAYYEKKKSSEELDLADIQFALLPGNDDSRLEQIKTDLTQLKDEDKIDDYISRITIEDGRKCLGGLLEPQCVNCSSQDQVIQFFSEGLQKNNTDFYISKSEGRSFVYRVTQRKKISPEDLESYLTKKFKKLKDKAIEYTNKNNSETEKQNAQYYLEDSPRLEEKAKLTAGHYLKGFQTRVIEEEMIRLENEKNIKLSEEVVNNPLLIDKPDYILLKLPEKNYTGADLDSDFSKLFPLSPKNTMEKLNFFKGIIIPTYLLADSDEGKAVKKSENFERYLKYHKQKILNDVIRNDIAKEDVIISDKELRDVYEAGKQFQFSKINPKDPNQKIVIPFEEVKEKIIQDMKGKLLEEKYQTKIASLRDSYKVVIQVEKLKEGSL